MRNLIVGCALLVFGSVGALAQGAPANEGAGGTPTPGPAQDTPAAQVPAQAGGTPGSAMGGTAETSKPMHHSKGGKHHAKKKHHHVSQKSTGM